MLGTKIILKKNELRIKNFFFSNLINKFTNNNFILLDTGIEK